MQYANQFTKNVCLVNAMGSVPVIDLLIIPNISNVNERSLSNLSMIDPDFDRWMKDFIKPCLDNGIKILGFNKGALSLYSHLGGTIQNIVGYNESKMRAMYQTYKSPLEVFTHLNEYIFGEIETYHAFRNCSNVIHTSELLKHRKEEESTSHKKYTIEGVFNSFINTNNNIAGILANPLKKENLSNSYDYKLSGKQIGDLLSNIYVQAMLNNVKI